MSQFNYSNLNNIGPVKPNFHNKISNKQDI